MAPFRTRDGGDPLGSLYSLILALASLATIAYLGASGVISGDAVAGMISAIVAFITGGQAAVAGAAAKNGAGTPPVVPGRTRTVTDAPATDQPEEESSSS